jgi:hypothetical protein
MQACDPMPIFNQNIGKLTIYSFGSPTTPTQKAHDKRYVLPFPVPFHGFTPNGHASRPALIFNKRHVSRTL